MADITKRSGKHGTSYRVRYICKSRKCGFASKTFKTLKQARAFQESGNARSEENGDLEKSISTMTQATDLWLDICEKEGRDGKDPVTPYTLKEYRRRAARINEYEWPDKPIWISRH
jgi:hypothetical protein